MVHPEDVPKGRRRLDLWLAGIAAAAAVAAAIFSGVTSWSVASYQSGAEDRRIRRAERLEAYTASILAAQRILQSSAEILPCDEGLPAVPYSPAQRAEQYGAYQEAAGGVYVVGTPEVADQQEDLDEEVRRIMRAQATREAAGIGQFLCAGNGTELFGARRATSDALSEFLNAARTDLGGDSLIFLEPVE